jgi:hypothetical protein
LNRYDPADRVPDAAQYRRMVVDGAGASYPPFSDRVLIPALARPLYRLLQGKLGTWDAAYFALLVVNSAFLAGTALLVFTLGKRTLPPGAALVAALLFLLNFSVSNQFLAGLVDSGEAFFLSAIVLALFLNRWWMLPIFVGIGSLAKETVLPFAIGMAVIWAAVQGASISIARKLFWIAIAVVCGTGVLVFVVDSQSGHVAGAWDVVRQQVHGIANWSQIVISLVSSHELWATFIYLLPLGLLRIRKQPREWKAALSVSLALALLLVLFHSDPRDVGSTFSRAAFSIAGPLLAVSAAAWLWEKLRSLEVSARLDKPSKEI